MEKKLTEYSKKRDFNRTPEPEGTASRTANSGLFVIHKHDASRLHYDLRLELDGVLLSWAIPKGPSLDPSNKRLAVHVEDHPLEYGDFEGTIPAGEYGGGTVMLWDRGTWIPEEDPRSGYAKGSLKFTLRGEKLSGSWALFRISKPRQEQDNWLLVKHRDEAALKEGYEDITETAGLSVKSGRTMDQIASQAESAAETNMMRGGEASPDSERLPDPSGLRGAKKKNLPSSFRPQLAKLVKKAPAGTDWLHEIKLDGYRLLVFVENGSVTMMTRNSQDWTARFPALVRAVARIKLPSVLLDGELVMLRPDGSSSFQALQNEISSGSGEKMVYFVFDVPYFNGYDLTKVAQVDRKNLLRSLLEASDGDRMIRFNDHQIGKGERFKTEACRAGLEGIVCKRADSPYQQTRSGNWLKVKCVKRQEFVIGGYTDPGGSRTGFGALLLGYYEQDGLQYCGRVGTGFSEQSLTELLGKMSGLERETPPFAESLSRGESRGVHWITPALVVEVVFTEWTGEGRLRHPSFQGLREDKKAEQVTREEPGPESLSQARISVSENSSGDIRVSGIFLSNPDRILYPEQGITKLALAEYYAKIGSFILPHLAGRPLMIARCPRGRDKKCFYQKHVNESLPDTVRGVLIREKEEERLYIVIDDLPGLISLVQLGALEFHPWGSRVDNIEQPDRMIFDLDPGQGVSFSRVVEAARELGELLRDGLDLRSFVRTTGGKGLHVVVPLVRTAGWEEVKNFAGGVAQALSGLFPEKYVATMSKEKRKGRIFLDYFRNNRGATAICSYSTRARPGAPVATPVSWAELTDLHAGDTYTVDNLPRLLAERKEDPWKNFSGLRQSLSKERRKKLTEFTGNR